MSKIKLVFLSFILFNSCQQKKQPSTETAFEYETDILTKEIKKMMEVTGIPSISIALIKEDSIIWAEAFGFANVKTKTPATTSTTYSTGSTVKPFLSMAIMQLVEKGLVNLDNQVNNYLKNPIPNFSTTSKPITLRHLLSHQSGIPASAVFVPIWGKDHRASLEEIASQIKPVRAPEKTHEYSNDGFVIAALVIENITQKSYGDYISENILKPLELENINFTQPTPETVEEIALPYRLIYNQAIPTAQLYAFPYPSGGLTYLTPSQMSRFLIAHLNQGIYKNNKILSAELMKEFHQTSFGHEYYGLGIGIEKKNNHTYLFHNGQDTYSSVFTLNLDLKTGVYLMTNAAAHHQMNALAELAMELLDGKKDYTPIPSFAGPSFKEIDLPEAESNKFIGTYQIEGTDFELRIFKKNNQLYLKNPANVSFEILPYEKDKFFLKTEEEQIEFTKEENQINGLILFSKGNEILATLISID